MCSFVGSILSWIGTDGQCLAAPHTHISTLEPDQLTHPVLHECYMWNGRWSSFQWETRTHPQNLRDYDCKVTNKGGQSKLAHYRCGSDWNEPKQSTEGDISWRDTLGKVVERKQLKTEFRTPKLETKKVHQLGGVFKKLPGKIWLQWKF